MALLSRAGRDGGRDSFVVALARFREAGRRISGLGLPTVFLLEGGYAIGAVGINVVNVLQGFEDAQK